MFVTITRKCFVLCVYSLCMCVLYIYMSMYVVRVYRCVCIGKCVCVRVCVCVGIECNRHPSSVSITADDTGPPLA